MADSRAGDEADDLSPPMRSEADLADKADGVGDREIRLSAKASKCHFSASSGTQKTSDTPKKTSCEGEFESGVGRHSFQIVYSAYL